MGLLQARRRLAHTVVAGLWVLVGAPATTAVGQARAASTAAVRYLDPTFTVDVQTDIVYGTAVNVAGESVTLTLDVYSPHGDLATSRPVLIWAHGGFFVFGSKESETAWAKRMAQRGYVTASINYRLSPIPVVAPVDTPEELQEINDARTDMQTAVRWFRANAASLRIDPDRIAVGGSSAGAVTALGVAVNNDDAPVSDHPGFSSAVCTAVSFSGANDPVAVDAADAGAIFHHGTEDTIVPFPLAVATTDAMRAAGLDVQWNEYAGEGHGLGPAAGALAEQRTIQWLNDRVATVPYPCSAAVARRTKVPAGTQTRLNGLPAKSAVVAVVAVGADSPGYVQALACGATPGASSNLNLDAPGQTRSVLAVVAIGADGSACLYNQPRTHLVADLQGYFAPGAFDDIVDQRILDTRSASKPGARSQTPISGRPNSTAVVSMVITETGGAGFVQILPCGSEPGAFSNLNADAARQTRSGLAFVRFGPSGTACIYTQTATHLVVDVQGYMAPAAFDDVADTRLLDTRPASPTAATDVVISGRPNSTAVISLVATDTVGPGYVQVHPCAGPTGGSSNLNTDESGQTVAGLAFVRFGPSGTACVYAQSPAQLVVDLQGYMVAGGFDDIADVRVLDTRQR